MRICEFSIDRFGILHNQHVSALSPGLSIFIGENEAGKSTCLNFFRAMLFGYARQRRSIDYLPDVKAVSGGSLLLETDLFGPVRLVRRPGPHGGPCSLATHEGTPLPESNLATLLRGCTPDVYDKVFAFSLGELMHFSSLAEDRVRHALHGAAFGLGLRSPGQVLKILDDDMRRIFAPRATNSRIHKLLQELDAVNATVSSRGNEVDNYALLRTELEQAGETLAKSRTTRLGMERDRRILEKKIALRRRWETLRRAESSLAELPEVPGAFTTDGLDRLERYAERMADRQHTLHASQLALERTENETASPSFAPALLEAAPALFTLLERKERIRDALADIRAFQAEKDALQGDITRVCEALGPRWKTTTLASCDLSLAVYERCDALGREFTASEQAAAFALREKERLEREHQAASLAVEEVLATLSGTHTYEDETASTLPIMNDDAAERLGQLLVRADDAAEKTGALALAVRNAEQALDRAVAELSPMWTRQNLEQANLPPGTRERLLSLALAVASSSDAMISAMRDKTAAMLLTEDIAERTNGLEHSVAGLLAAMPGEAATVADASVLLDARRDTLRRVRATRATLETAQAAYASANEQLGDIASLIRGTRRTSAFPWATLILFLAALLLVCGGGLLYLGLSSGAENMTMGGTGALAAGGSLAVAWLALAAQKGADAVSETVDRNWTAIEQRLIRARINAHAAYAEAEDALALFAADIPDIFPGGILDADLLAEAEQLVTLQRERLIVLERETRELERERHSLTAAERRLAVAEEHVFSATQALNTARSTWHDALSASGLPSETPPEDARVLLERFDAALARRSHWQGRLAEQRHAEETLDECLRFARSLPGMTDRLASLPEPGSHLAPAPGPWLDEVRAYLTEWRQAGRERIRLRELVSSRSDRRNELASLLEASRQAADKAADAADAHATAWRSWLIERHLSQTLSPETARQVLDTIARAKNSLQAVQRLETRIDTARGDTLAFARELAVYAALIPENAALASMAVLLDSPDGETLQQALSDPGIIADLLAALDALASSAREAREKSAIAEAKKRELPALRDAVDIAAEHAASAKHELQEMLDAACCGTAEEYRHAHAAWEKYEAALAEQKAAFSAFTQEAAEADIVLEDAMSSFAISSREDTELRLAEKEVELSEALAAEHALAERKGGLDAAMAALLNEQGLTALLAERENIIAEITSLSQEWSRLAIARDLLLTAKGRFETERQTGVVRFAGELFKMITNGAYNGITVSLDDETVGAVTKGGVVLRPETELSRGTREQLYLALRLAYILDHGMQAEKLPVIMDDILVNFDAARAARTAEALAVVAKEHQILFFTCHNSTAAMLANAVPGAVQYQLQQGAFIAV